MVNKPTRYYSSRQEKTVAKLVDGRVNANSGAAPFTAGDVSSKDTLYECKTVTKPSGSYSVKKAVLDKIRQEAYAMGKDNSVLAFNFEPDGDIYFVLTQKHYLSLLKAIQKHE